MNQSASPDPSTPTFRLRSRKLQGVLAAVVVSGISPWAASGFTREPPPDSPPAPGIQVGDDNVTQRLTLVIPPALLITFLLPAAMSHAIGSETQRPIAVVVVGGTISAALLTLIVLPVTYYWACVLRERLARRRDAEPVIAAM